MFKAGFRFLNTLNMFFALDAHAKTFVISVGSNSSVDQRARQLEYAARDAGEFGTAMSTVGAVDSADIVALKNPEIKAFSDSLERASARLNADANFTKLIFFFSGHADERGLHFRDGFFSKNKLNAYLSQLLLKTKVVILDSCYAGLLSSKGVKPAPGFGAPKLNFDEPTGVIFLTAASGQDQAFESNKLKSGLFSHAIIEGLYGAADTSHDGVVTTNSLYEYAFRQTQLSSYLLPTPSIQKPEFAADLRGRGTIALSFPALTLGQLRLSSEVNGTVEIVSSKGISAFSQFKNSGNDKTMSLPVGQYRIQINDSKRQGKTDVQIAPRTTAIVTGEDITWVNSDKFKFSAKSPTAAGNNYRVSAALGANLFSHSINAEAAIEPVAAEQWLKPTLVLRMLPSLHLVDTNHKNFSLSSAIAGLLEFKSSTLDSMVGLRWLRLVGGPGMLFANSNDAVDCTNNYSCQTSTAVHTFLGSIRLGTEITFWSERLVLGLRWEKWWLEDGSSFGTAGPMFSLSLGTSMSF